MRDGVMETAIRRAYTNGLLKGLREGAHTAREAASTCDHHGTEHFCEQFGCHTLDGVAATLDTLADEIERRDAEGRDES